jgi:hypothetical protein
LITIRVYRSGGGPQANKLVRVHSKFGVSDGRTDTNGTVNFPNLKRGDYEVYVDGKRIYNGPVVDVQVVYI